MTTIMATLGSLVLRLLYGTSGIYIRTHCYGNILEHIISCLRCAKYHKNVSELRESRTKTKF